MILPGNSPVNVYPCSGPGLSGFKNTVGTITNIIVSPVYNEFGVVTNVITELVTQNFGVISNIVSTSGTLVIQVNNIENNFNSYIKEETNEL